MQNPAHALEISAVTLRDYDRGAEEYWGWTKDQDLSADYDWFLAALPGPGPHDLLDLGCGPGRDLLQLRQRGHRAVGLDGSRAMVRMARRYAGCPVLHQNFLELRLRPGRFAGIFASASLFHVPIEALPEVLAKLHAALRGGGILYTLNPRGRGQSGWAGDRYCTYHSMAAWRRLLRATGFRELGAERRPKDSDRSEQRWIASLWKRE